MLDITANFFLAPSIYMHNREIPGISLAVPFVDLRLGITSAH
jgi:hypothetical protein